jgi:hypothetical protein
MEVPLMVLRAVLLVCHALVMLVPGAYRSTQVAQLEKYEAARRRGRR